MRAIIIAFCSIFSLVFLQIFVCLVCVVFGCGTVADPKSPTFLQTSTDVPGSFIDPAFSEIFRQYMIDMKACGLDDGNISEIQRVEFGNTEPSGLLGYCNVAVLENAVNHKTGRIYRFVAIDKNLLPGKIRDSIVYHELAHCIHGGPGVTVLPHSNEPGSIMYPTANMDEIYWSVVWPDRVAGLCKYIKDVRGLK